MDRQSHLAIDKAFFGRGCNSVHAWIDSMFPVFKDTSPYKHWLTYHHKQAIKERYKEGSMSYNSAYLHILADTVSHFGIPFMPENREEMEKFLKERGVL